MRTDSLALLFDQPGPFASVLVDISQDGEEGAEQPGLRVDEALQQLEANGAPEPVVQQLRETLDKPIDKSGPISRLVVATEAGICLDDLVQEPLDASVATWSPLPDVALCAKLHDVSIPFLLVIADREGSDIEVYRASTREPDETATISGETEHIHKVKVGGWAQDHYQNHTEEVWRRNARQSAEVINKHVDNGIQLVLVAGDERARVELTGVLSTKAAACAVQVDAGGRAAGSSREALEAAAADVLRAEVVKRRLDWVRQYQERRGRGDAV
ncbi:MAG: Vms1/Ankzf1 family peptidyl-tRNA hydrolase, partial [Nocardioidaceae bacterium]